MKFLHMADMHFDSTFSILSANEMGDKRRFEQREAFKKIIDLIIENNIEYFFIAGDLYEHNQIRKSTMEFIIKQLERIPKTKVFITPGNHDPYVRGSFYDIYNFPENVFIFKDKIEMYEDENVKIFGTGFTDFYISENPIEQFKPENDLKTKILISHVSVNGFKSEDGYSYNPILLSKLKELNMDYIALGHIHDRNIIEEKKIKYSGSTVSLGFDELGEHGVIIGEIDNHNLKTEFVKIDNRQFTVKELNVDNASSEEEIAELINEINGENDEMFKIVLIGNKNFEIDTNKILRLISNKNVLKIKDKTKVAIDLEKISKQNTIKGLFVKQVLEKYENQEISEEDMQEIIQIGLDSMQ